LTKKKKKRSGLERRGGRGKGGEADKARSVVSKGPTGKKKRQLGPAARE